MKIARAVVRRLIASLVFLAAGLYAPQLVEAVVIVDQATGLGGGNAKSNISDYVTAENFSLSQAATPTSLRVWLADANNNNNDTLDNFSGNLSVAPAGIDTPST